MKSTARKICSYLILLDRWATLSCSLVVTLSLTFFHLPFFRGPMYGDDFLGVRDSLMPNSRSGFWVDFWLAGAGKWRPISTPIILWMGRSFGFSYLPYLYVNLFLLAFCSIYVGFIGFQLTKSKALAVSISAAAAVSHFTWLSQISIYGAMELLATIFLLIGFSASIAATSSARNSSRYMLISFLAVIASSYSHERFLIAAPIFALYYFLQRYSMSGFQRRLPALFLTIPVTHVFIKSFVLNLNPIQGGGEGSAGSGFNFGFLSRYIDALGMLFGFHSSSGIFYSSSIIGETANNSALRWQGFIILLIGIFAVGLLFRVFKKAQGAQDCLTLGGNNRHTLLAIALSLALLVPASTVTSRIEGRWIYASQVFLLFAVSSYLMNHMPRNLIRTIAFCVLPVSYALLSIAYFHRSESYTVLRDVPSKVVTTLDLLTRSKKPWVLAIDSRASTLPLQWQFGYGGVFSQLANPPYRVDWNGVCPELLKRVECLTVVFGDDLPNPEYRRSYRVEIFPFDEN